MTADVDSLVLEHLRHIRARVDQTAEDIVDLKPRMTSLENAMNLVRRAAYHLEETDTLQQVTLDRLAERVSRIERRLELTEGS